ncbi:MAG: Uma2 family endonuclease [Taibaiella sp.]|nr:Uma2 family endonuclease [Taibaiella sp.]
MEVNDPAIAYHKKRYTIKEYLEMEDAATEKHEYYKGEIFAMSGASVNHNIITGNLYYHLRGKLSVGGCKPFAGDFRIYIPQNSLFTYPDISIICGAIETLDNDNINVLNPSVIIEVLSHSTRSYDSREKFELYKAIPSLKEYILVDSLAVFVQVSMRDGVGNWSAFEYNYVTQAAEIKSVNISVSIDSLYGGVTF